MLNQERMQKEKELDEVWQKFFKAVDILYKNDKSWLKEVFIKEIPNLKSLNNEHEFYDCCMARNNVRTHILKDVLNSPQKSEFSDREQELLWMSTFSDASFFLSYFGECFASEGLFEDLKEYYDKLKKKGT